MAVTKKEIQEVDEEIKEDKEDLNSSDSLKTSINSDELEEENEFDRNPSESESGKGENSESDGDMIVTKKEGKSKEIKDLQLLNQKLKERKANLVKEIQEQE